jgi:hypothetical protein
MAEGTARTIAREWWREHIESSDELNIRQLAHQAGKELCADPEFRDAFVDDFADSIMYEMGQRMVAGYRAQLRTTSGLRAAVDADAQREGEKWDRWFHYVPSTKTAIPIPKMNKAHLLSAAEAYQHLADSNAIEATWLRKIAAKLKNGQLVEDVMTQEDVEHLRPSTPTPLRKAA